MGLRNPYEKRFDEESGKQLDATDCPECDGELVTDGGETLCTNCGLIVTEDRLDRGPEWRSFADEDVNRSRTGAPLTQGRHDRGLSTKIGHNVDGWGRRLSGKKRRQLNRLRREHSRGKFRSKAERNLALAFVEIARLCGALDLPKVVREEASTIYRRAQDEDLIKGRSIEIIAAGCIYAACRCGPPTRTLEEIGEGARCDQDEVKLGYTVLNRELGLESRPQRPVEHIPRIASECDVPRDIENRARELVKLAVEAGLANGRRPSGVAAGCLYLAGQEARSKLTQRELSEVAGVTDVTVRNRYRELKAERDEPSTEQ